AFEVVIRLTDYAEDQVPILIKDLAEDNAAYYAAAMLFQMGPRAQLAVPTLVNIYDRQFVAKDAAYASFFAIEILRAIGREAIDALPVVKRALNEKALREKAATALISID